MCRHNGVRRWTSSPLFCRPHSSHTSTHPFPSCHASTHADIHFSHGERNGCQGVMNEWMLWKKWMSGSDEWMLWKKWMSVCVDVWDESFISHVYTPWHPFISSHTSTHAGIHFSCSSIHLSHSLTLTVISCCSIDRNVIVLTVIAIVLTVIWLCWQFLPLIVT